MIKEREKEYIFGLMGIGMNENFKKGKREGKGIHYFTNGKKHERDYKNGKRDDKNDKKDIKGKHYKKKNKK